MISFRYRSNFKGAKKLKLSAAKMAAVNKKLGVVYLTFVQRRYNKLGRSGGGGEWKPLAASTLARRRSGKKGRKGRKRTKSTLMRDTGLLYASLQPGATGNTFNANNEKVRVGFSFAKHSGGMTFTELAKIHNAGLGNNPKRAILVDPDAATRRRMTKLVAKEYKEKIKKASQTRRK